MYNGKYQHLDNANSLPKTKEAQLFTLHALFSVSVPTRFYLYSLLSKII